MNVSGLPDMLAGYVQSMRYVDEALAAFFELLAKRAYVEDTVIVLYGDHESKIALDRTAEARAAEVLSLDAQTVKDIAKRSVATRKVPLLIVLPGATEGRTIDKVGGQIDISPTLLHLFGLEKPKSMIGTPLFGSGGAVFRADGSSVEGDRVRLPDGDCRTISGTDLPVGACEHLATRGDEQLRNPWAITQHNLAVSLPSGRSARR
jgi:phosphoglycerol transferase MdoB-like AlkP superfamily enzyme